MKSATPSHRRSERGMTIMEALVAVLVFSIVFMAALALYHAANKAYLQTDAATIQQQNVRFALDRVAQTLRDAGANHNVAGASNLPDEQIEGAWETAVFVRGDFDDGRESLLENTLRPIVTTGNDEIVGYVLRKPGANSRTLQFNADTTVTGGRNATISGTTITGEESLSVEVAVTSEAEQTNPPYELTRVTFNDAGVAQYEVIAENIFRLRFNYLRADGTAAVTTYGGADAQRGERAAIRAIRVQMTGMANRPDMSYTDSATYTPAETAATKHYRKLSFDEQILGVNLGLKGRRHVNAPAVTIAAPASISVCIGHCRYFRVSWPNSSTAGVTTYNLRVSAPAAGSSPAFTQNIPVLGNVYHFRQPDATVRAYSFEVAGSSGANIGTYTSIATLTSLEHAASVPSAPQNLTASQASGGVNAMYLQWSPVATNNANINTATCTTVAGVSTTTANPTAPWQNQAIDAEHYRVYRVRSTGTNNGASVAGVDTERVDAVGPLHMQGDLVNSTPTTAVFTDNTAAPCTQYWYRVRTCDLCGTQGDLSAAMGTAVSFPAATGVRPAAPASLAPAVPITYPATPAGNYAVQLRWPAVTRTEGGDRAAVAHYVIQRLRKTATDPDYIPDATIDVYESTTSAVDNPPAQYGGASVNYRYVVRAQYDCGVGGGGNRLSDPSPAFDLRCAPPAGHSLTIASPTVGTSISRPLETSVPITLTVSGATWTSIRVTITGPDGQVYDQTRAAGTFDTFPAFDASTLRDGVYSMVVTGTTATSCGLTLNRDIEVSTGTCGLRIATAGFQGSGNSRATSMNFTVQNTCDVNLSLSGITPVWEGAIDGIRITGVSGAANWAGSASTGGNGSRINFNNSVQINAGTTSSTFTLSFSDNFTSDGDRDSPTGRFTSILGHLSSPSGQNDELAETPVP